VILANTSLSSGTSLICNPCFVDGLFCRRWTPPGVRV
jgi:hypothetical protein